MRIAVLVVAAGRGLRAGGDVPKQYQPLRGAPLLRRSVTALLACPQISAVRVVFQPADQLLYDAAVAGLDIMQPVAGGDTRQESVRLGLESLEGLGFDTILVHDAARPFPGPGLIERVLAAVGPSTGSIPALPVADSLKRVHHGIIQEAVARDDLWRAQTPQAFPFAGLLAAHQRFKGREMTDDAAVAQAAGMAVRIVPGEEDNFKVTEADDFRRAEQKMLAALGDIRVGSGFDVHAFAPGDHITLCGLKIAHGFGLAGHSDADVGLHALTDALLGAIGAGDIGQHFPPTDARWKGAASDQFLKHAAALIAAQGGMIAHVDVTIICEAPKISPHRAAMAARVAEILELPLSRVSIKATTTEQLGFTGRREGIAAQATATIRLPLEDF